MNRRLSLTTGKTVADGETAAPLITRGDGIAAASASVGRRAAPIAIASYKYTGLAST